MIIFGAAGANDMPSDWITRSFDSTPFIDSAKEQGDLKVCNRKKMDILL